MKPKPIFVETPIPPAWVADDATLTGLWDGSLSWRIEMLAAGDDLDRQDQIRHLAHDLADARQVITLAEAERRWGYKNLRANGPKRGLTMWQDQPGSPWLTTVQAMEVLYGTEPE